MNLTLLHDGDSYFVGTTRLSAKEAVRHYDALGDSVTAALYQRIADLETELKETHEEWEGKELYTDDLADEMDDLRNLYDDVRGCLHDDAPGKYGSMSAVQQAVIDAVVRDQEVTYGEGTQS